MSEGLGNSGTEAVSEASQEISQRDKAMVALRMFTSALDEWNGLLKLQLGLQTGAAVLFVKVLTDLHSPAIVMVILAISIAFFAASALDCLRLLGGLVELRAKIVETLVDTRTNWSEFVSADLAEWRKKMEGAGRRMERLFRLAILFAVIFVVGVLITR